MAEKMIFVEQQSGDAKVADIEECFLDITDSAHNKCETYCIVMIKNGAERIGPLVFHNVPKEAHAEHYLLKHLRKNSHYINAVKVVITMYLNYSPCNSKGTSEAKAECCQHIIKFVNRHTNVHMNINFVNGYKIQSWYPESERKQNITGLQNLIRQDRITLTQFKLHQRTSAMDKVDKLSAMMEKLSVKQNEAATSIKPRIKRDVNGSIRKEFLYYLSDDQGNYGLKEFSSHDGKFYIKVFVEKIFFVEYCGYARDHPCQVTAWALNKLTTGSSQPSKHYEAVVDLYQTWNPGVECCRYINDLIAEHPNMKICVHCVNVNDNCDEKNKKYSESVQSAEPLDSKVEVFQFFCPLPGVPELHFDDDGSVGVKFRKILEHIRLYD